MDNQDKFTVSVNLDTEDASKKIKNLNKEVKQTGENVEQQKKLNIDTKDAVNNLKNADSSIKEVADDMDKVANKSSGLMGIAGKLTAVIGTVVALGYALKKVYDITSDTSHEIVTLGNKASALFMNTNNLKAWETSFKSIGLSAQEAGSALGGIQGKVVNQLFQPSPQTAALFSRLGVQMHDEKGQPKNPEQILEESTRSLRKMDAYSAQFYGTQLGLSPEAIAQLRNSKTFDKTLAQQKAKPVVTKEQEQQARGFLVKEADLGSTVDQLKNRALMPMAETIADKVIPTLNTFNKTLLESINVLSNGMTQTNQNLASGKSVIQNVGGMPMAVDKNKSITYSKMSDYLIKKSTDVLSYVNQVRAQGEMDRQGISPQRQEMMKNVISKESKYINEPSKTLATTGARKGQPLVYGMAQFMPETIQGLIGKNAEPLRITDTIKALDKEIDAFSTYAKKRNIPVNESTFYTYHHLGQGGFNAAVNAQAGGATTLGDVYDKLSPSGKMRSQNNSIANAILPDLQPNSGQSSVVSNITHNNQTTSNSATTNIANLHIQSNDPKGFANSLIASTGKLDMTNAMTGVLA